MEKDKIYNKEYLISYGFKQDEEEEYIFYYYDDEEKGFISYNITNDMDRCFISNIIQEIQMKEDNKKKLEYEQQNEIVEYEPIKTKSKKIKKEKTEEVICTHEDVRTKTTGNEFNSMSLLNEIGNFNRKDDKMESYVYAKDLEYKLTELKEQGVKVPCLKTIKRHIKKLSQITVGEDNINLITVDYTPNGACYKILQKYDGKFYITIPIKQLNELLTCTNSNMLKLYCVFRYSCNTEEFTEITRSYLVQGMGMEVTEANKNYVSNMITSLRKLGYIKVYTERIFTPNCDLQYKEKNYYKLTTYEEWKQINKTVGIVKKK